MRFKTLRQVRHVDDHWKLRSGILKPSDSGSVRIVADSEKAAMQRVFEHHSWEVPVTSIGRETLKLVQVRSEPSSNLACWLDSRAMHCGDLTYVPTARRLWRARDFQPAPLPATICHTVLPELSLVNLV